MYKAILLSIGSPTILGIYYEAMDKKAPKLIFILRVDGKTSDVLPLLFVAHNRDGVNIHEQLESLLTPEVLSQCRLCECLIDINFLEESKELQYILKKLDINYSSVSKQDIMQSDTDSKITEVNQKNLGLNRSIDSKADLLLQEHMKACHMQHVKESLSIQNKIYMNDAMDCITQINFIEPECNLAKALYLLSQFMPLDSIYYSRGVGSLSAIKLTHIFLHTLSLSSNVCIYATNSFYFSQTNEIKAFANMSFYLDTTRTDSTHPFITDSNAKDYIYIAPSSMHTTNTTDTLGLLLPYRLIHNDFLESCTPLYVTSAV